MGVRNKAGQWVHPNAKIMIPSVEHAFWMDDTRMAAAPDAMKGAFQTVRRMLGGLGSDQLIKFEAGVEIVPAPRLGSALGTPDSSKARTVVQRLWGCIFKPNRPVAGVFIDFIFTI